jgi:endonuclease YncB( thermonuclease family)
VKNLKRISKYVINVGLIIFLLFLTVSLGSAVESEPVKVRRVIDGDTLEIDYAGKTERVRLIGVDTPETVHPSLTPFPLRVDAPTLSIKTTKKVTKAHLQGENMFSNWSGMKFPLV